MPKFHALNPSTFAQEWWNFQWKKTEFEDHLLDLGDKGFDFEDIATDHYDLSLELYQVRPDQKLNEQQQLFLKECGFLRVYVTHTDNIETHYDLSNPPTTGWRCKRT